MATATLNSNGQTTIPDDIRMYFGLHMGDKLEFLINEMGDVILKPVTDVTELKSLLPKTENKINIKKMNKIIANRGAQS